MGLSVGRRSRFAVGLTAVAVAIAAVPATASAAPVASVGISGGTLSYTAALGKTITPYVNVVGGSYQITESGTITDADGPGGCTLSTNLKIAICPKAGITRVALTGSSGNDQLINWPNVTVPTTLTGNGGNDALTGGSGADLIDGGLGRDSIYGVGANNAVDGGDTINGGPDNDTVIAGPGSDSVDGGKGADQLDGGAGSDLISYEGRTDSIQLFLGSPVKGVIKGGGIQDDDPSTRGSDRDTVNGFESIAGGNAADYLDGDTNANVLIGNGGGDWLYGDAQSDWLLGGEGDDVLQGGADVDYEIGGPNDDTYMGATFGADDGADVLLDGGLFGIPAGGSNYFFTNGDHAVDGIGCGPDDDHVEADGNDVLSVPGFTTPAACEHVTLK